jgi:hypothetical protein
MNITKATVRERKNRKKRYGMVMDSKSVFTIEEQINKRDVKKKSKHKKKMRKEKYADLFV